MILDFLIGSSAPVWMIDNDTHLVIISVLLIESSTPVWIIDNDIHLMMISVSWLESSAPVWLINGNTHLVWMINWVSVSMIRCISLSIIHTGADDSNNDTEIITRCTSLLIIHIGADEPIKFNKSCTSVVCLFNKGCCDGCCYHFFIDYYFLSPQGQ